MQNKNIPHIIAKNRKIHHRYDINRVFEAGIVLQGWEVKSIRAHNVQLSESYILAKKGELWLYNLLINPLSSSSSHVIAEPGRARKLLMHRREVDKITSWLKVDRLNAIPISLETKNSFIKVNFAVGTAKKSYDKRADLKEKDWLLDKQRFNKKIKR